ncbi:DUF4139 domain-containing protein [Tropicibacter sp. Alg240-R139]|uniref:DUF4139 domain-containing protein n=1 Tax=Tropicibacter sp. Alg240-R139 TaxID=2305991 RepID=UPI0013E0795D|nr:DUF4139 domain-containing protein [Tropicibacter sp. Alg240-R139]
MRFLLALFLVTPFSAFAADIQVNTRVSEITMHPDSAAILRTATVEVPAGQHRLVLLGIPSDIVFESLRVNVEGVERLGLTYRDEFAPPRDYTSPQVKAAQDTVRAVELQIQKVRDQAERARLAATASETSIGFLRNLGKNEGLAQVAPDTLRDIARMIEQEALTAGQTAQSAEVEAREIERQLETLEEDLEHAQAALHAVSLEDQDRLYLTLDTNATEASTAQVTLKYLAGGASQWTPIYDINLVTGDTPQINIKRDAMVQQYTGENWQGVTLHLSTVAPIGQTESRWLTTNKLRVRDPEQRQKVSSADLSSGNYGNLAEPALEAPVIVEETQSGWNIASDGPGVTYTYSRPVSVASSADFLRLELDNLAFDAEVTATATPRFDETAYRLAAGKNTSNEEILPSELAAFYVDDVLVGTEHFGGAVPGQELELGFGPIDGLRLKRDVLNRSQGDTGLISRSNQRVEQVEIEIENFTDQEWTLRLTDRVPYSEQEDLVIDWSATPAPSEENVDNRRGILAWDIDMKAGAKQKIRLNTSISWPEGMELR